MPVRTGTRGSERHCPTVVRHASINGATRAPAPAARADRLMPLAEMSAVAWRALSRDVAEPNGYYLPGWELAVNASARDRVGASALTAWSDASGLIGLVPVISMWRTYKIPLPALVSADPYGTLCTPLLDRTMAAEAAADILRQARQAGAHTLIFRATSLDGAAMKAFADALRCDGLAPLVLQLHVRACLDATRDADDVLRDALGTKKLKELRRQRNRLAEHGAVQFDVAHTPEGVAAALETFLDLEASGWKAKRGTALGQHAGDVAFIRRATCTLAETGQCEIVTLRAGETPVAAAIVLRHQDRRLLLQARRRRAFREIFAGRAVDARSDPAPLCRPVDRDGGFHRESRSCHDQPNLARAPFDRRRADPVAAARSSRLPDPHRTDAAQRDPRASAPLRSFA